jgi:hypothetical protein
MTGHRLPIANTPPTEKSKAMCEGCRDDYYNGKNERGIKECWMYAGAKVVRRFKIGWWTQPSSRDAFEEVTTLGCHNAAGRYALYEELPAHLSTL